MPPALYPFQKAAVDRMMELDSVLLFDDMGLGKSLEVIETVERLQAKPALVIPPKTLALNWLREIKKWYPDEEPVLFTTPEEFVNAYLAQADTGVMRWFIWWHDALLQSVDTNRYYADNEAAFLSKVAWKAIIIDEAHKFRNPGTIRTEALQRFKSVAGQKRFILTGTPIVNSAADLYPLLQFAQVPNLPESWVFNSTFTNRGPSDRMTGLRDKTGLLRLVGDRWIRRTKAQVLKDLPPKTEQVMHLQMSAEQRAAYDRMLIALMLELEDGKEIVIPSGPMEHLALMTRLRQLALDPLILGKKTPSIKTQTVWDLLDSHANEGKKAVIFSNFTQYIRLLEQALRDDHFKVESITGDTSMIARDRIVNDFQTKDNPQILLANMAAGGEGLNLHRADLVIITDMWWNKVRMSQAIDRLHRIGQTNPVTAITLHIENSVDDIMAAIVESKDADSRTILIGLVKQAMVKNAALLRKLGISEEIVVRE